DRALRAVVDADDGPSLSSHLMRLASVEQFRAFLMQRSIYHLKEADPHTWVIPRLAGRTKAALVEIQADEYGGGRPGRMHAELFARTLRAAGLDATYGAYWPEATAETFATVNVMSLLGLHRRYRGAALGHLAALEMTSTTPNRRYANGLRRLGYGGDATRFFDEHVQADAVHEQLAAVDLCGSFVATEPDLRADVLWGAACCLELDAAAGRALLERFGVERFAVVA
ncbi:MAG: iron-containing redox enzyme family protein, partial [Mycobacteriales bacterium]